MILPCYKPCWLFAYKNSFFHSSILSFHRGAPSPEKNPGSVPEHINLLFSFSAFTLILIFSTFLSIDLKQLEIIIV